MTVILGLVFVASLRKEWPMTFIVVHCPYCQNDQIVKRGKTAKGTQRYYAGCSEPRLEDGGSRRYLCGSVPRCLDLYPGGVLGARTHYFPTTIGLPPVPMRSAHRNNPLSDFRAGVISGLQSFAHVHSTGISICGLP